MIVVISAFYYITSINSGIAVMNVREDYTRRLLSASAILDDVKPLRKRVSLKALLTLYNIHKNFAGDRRIKPGNGEPVDKTLKISTKVLGAPGARSP